MNTVFTWFVSVHVQWAGEGTFRYRKTWWRFYDQWLCRWQHNSHCVRLQSPDNQVADGHRSWLLGRFSELGMFGFLYVHWRVIELIVDSTGLLSWECLSLSSSRIKDTLGHTSTPVFSVDSKLLHYFPVCRCFSNFVVWCLSTSNSFLVFRAFSLYHSYQANLPVHQFFDCTLNTYRIISQCTAYLGSLLSSIRRTYLSHLGFLSFMMRVSCQVVSVPWPSRYWLENAVHINSCLSVCRLYGHVL